MKKVAWYYAKDDQQQGPVAWGKLCEMAASGELSRKDLVWSDGASDWYPAAQAEGLTFAEGGLSANGEPAVIAGLTDVSPPDHRAEPSRADPSYQTTSPDEERSSDPSADGDKPAAESPPPPPEQTSRQSPEIKELGDLTGISFADAVRVAINDAWSAFRILIVSPTGQLAAVHRQLGPLRGMMVGVVYGVAYFGCFVLGSGAALGFFYALVGGLLAPLVLFGGVLAARSICHAKGDYQSDIFLAGCALLPLGFATLIGGVLGPVQLGLPVLLNTFALCYAALILFRGFSSICGLSETVAMLAAPAVLAACLWIVSRAVVF